MKWFKFDNIRYPFRSILLICTRDCLLRFIIFTFISSVIFNVIFIITDSRNTSNDKLMMKELSHKHGDDLIISAKEKRRKLNDAVNINSLSTRTLHLEVKSSKDHVYVAINGFKVYENSDSSGKSRGLNIVVINQFNGVVMTIKKYDTCVGYATEEDMKAFLENVHKGRIVVFTVFDDAAYHLTEIGRTAIQSLGSNSINDLNFRDMWAYICVKNGGKVAELIHANLVDDSVNVLERKHAAPVVISGDLQLESKSDDCYVKESTIMGKLRAQFCGKYEGYGEICDCNATNLIDLKAPTLIRSRVTNVPITVIAANRPHYLNRMLRKLLQTPGVDSDMITVYIDGFYDETLALIDLYQIKSVEHIPICAHACRISQHYKRALRETFMSHPGAEYAIILEEDLEVSEDIMDYFSQLLPILGSDPSLYCISAWNDNAYAHSSNDPSMLYRVESMPGLGWVLKKKLFQELEPQWPGTDYGGDWDLWMRTDKVRKGRECIIPDVPRTYHFSKFGAHVDSMAQSKYFAKKVVNNVTGIKFDTKKMSKIEYEKEMNRLIKNAKLLNHSSDPCTDSEFIPSKSKGKTFVAYLKWEHQYDYATWISFAKCLRLWDRDARGFHKGMWRFWTNKNHVIAVGSSSAYAIHKPDDITPISITEARNKI